MGIFAFMQHQDALQDLVGMWLDKRRALKQARTDTLEAMFASRVIGEIALLEERESDIERDLTRLEIKIDAALA